MTNDDHLPQRRVARRRVAGSKDRVEFFAEPSGRAEETFFGRVAKHPDLVVVREPRDRS